MTTRAGVDPTKGDRELDRLQARSARVARSISNTIRQTAQLGILLAAAFGHAIDQSIALGIEAILLTVEGVARIAAAEAITGIGIIKAGLLSAQIILLLETARRLETQRNANVQRTNALIQGLALLAH